MRNLIQDIQTLVRRFRHKQKAPRERAREKARAERRNAEQTLRLDDLVSGFARPIQDDEEEFQSFIGEDFNDEPDWGRR